MRATDWRGVIPAITTPFHADLKIDEPALQDHVTWLLDSGCRGIVALGSLGEGAALSFDEKLRVLALCREAIGKRAPLIAGVAALTTAECVRIAARAAELGCDGLMVLPPYLYRGDNREIEAHYRTVFDATPLSCMLYNNPLAYGTDVLPSQLERLIVHDNLHALKESSGDIRRVIAIHEYIGDRLQVFAGMDDLIVESVAVGAVGWIAGLVNALPEESVRLFDLAVAGRFDEARALYEWFLPLLRLDTVPKFVQLIKLVQAECGRGSATVRPPRLELAGDELLETRALIRRCLEARPMVEVV